MQKLRKNIYNYSILLIISNLDQVKTTFKSDLRLYEVYQISLMWYSLFMIYIIII